MNLHDDDFTVALHSVDSERAILGALLQDNNAFDRISDKITPGMFFDRSHQLVAKRLFAMLADGKGCDVITLSDDLSGRDELESAGGFGYLVQLVQDTASAANIRRYADIVASKAIARGAMHVCSELIENLQTPMGLTASELVTRAAGSLETLTEDRAAEEKTLDAAALGRHALELLDKRMNLPEGHFDGLPTGFSDVDKLLQGLKGGDLVIIAGRPGMGKTVLAMNIAEHVGRYVGNAFVFSMEMSESQLGDRQIASLTGIPLAKLKAGELTQLDWDLVANYTRIVAEEMRMFTDFRSSLSISQVRSKCRQLQRKHGKPAVIIIDYLQLMTAAKAENRNQEISQISAGLKSLAKDFECPVIALSQLSRDVEKRTDKRPMMSDLRDSGAIEQDADVILFPYRDEYYNRDSPDKGTVELIVGKFRQGEPRPVRLEWQGECARMRNLAHGWAPQATKQKVRYSGGGFND